MTYSKLNSLLLWYLPQNTSTLSNRSSSFLFTAAIGICLQREREITVSGKYDGFQIPSKKHPSLASWLTSLKSKYDLASSVSRCKYLSGCSCFSFIMGSVCLRSERAAPNSLSSISSNTIYRGMEGNGEQLHGPSYRQTSCSTPTCLIYK